MRFEWSVKGSSSYTFVVDRPFLKFKDKVKFNSAKLISYQWLMSYFSCKIRCAPGNSTVLGIRHIDPFHRISHYGTEESTKGHHSVAR